MLNFLESFKQACDRGLVHREERCVSFILGVFVCQADYKKSEFSKSIIVKMTGYNSNGQDKLH